MPGAKGKGGMAVDAGASGRTGGAATFTGQDTIVRPAYRVSAQIFKPTTPATFTGFLDPSSISFWRLAIGAAAVAYIMGFHLKIGKVRIKV